MRPGFPPPQSAAQQSTAAPSPSTPGSTIPSPRTEHGLDRGSTPLRLPDASDRQRQRSSDQLLRGPQPADSVFAWPASEPEFENPRWKPTYAPSAKQATESKWRDLVSRTPLIVWVLAAIAMVQAAVITVWLLQAYSGSSAAALSANMGSVVVTSQPPDAAVLIDDIPRGVTPLTVSLVPGQHQVTVGLDGTMRSQSVDIVAGNEAPVHFDIGPGAPVKAPGAAAAAAATAITGAVNVNTDPTGAQVFVDNVSHGVSPLSVTDLKPGVHVINVRDSGRSVTQRVMVTGGAVATVFIAMGGRKEFESGSLSIKSPIRVQIRERGALVGTSESAAVMLPTGLHTLELTNPDLNYRVERTVQIQAGRTSSLELTVPNGVLHINALPWAEVWIDGRALGETPIANVGVTPGTHELVFKHPELGERRQSVVVRASSPTRVGIDLRKGQ
jgi:PEGA domain-containing protein